jgi:hypothetical protein
MRNIDTLSHSPSQVPIDDVMEIQARNGHVNGLYNVQRAATHYPRWTNI